MSPDRSVLTVAGEASGDRMAGAVAARLGARDVRCFGMGGAASVAAGVDVVSDLRRTTAMGTVEVARRIPALVAAYIRLKRVSLDRRPQAAVLVNYTEFNLVLGRWLRRRGIRVLFVVAPQVWAWRPGRMQAVARALDRLAVILPFEEPLWRAAGVDARYVGHPALDVEPAAIDERQRLGIAAAEEAIALLPGSRPAEVRLLAVPMLQAWEKLARGAGRRTARVFVAPSLDSETRAWLSSAAHRFGVPLVDVDATRGAMPHLSAFDAAISASGTATLESALSGAAPVVVYRMSRMSAALAKRLVRTPHIALPNVVLGRRCYPEIVQDEVDGQRIAEAVGAVLRDRQSFSDAASELRRILEADLNGDPGVTVADRCLRMIEDWICA
jgi:lipid-A-disaccharide synthase